MLLNAPVPTTLVVEQTPDLDFRFGFLPIFPDLLRNQIVDCSKMTPIDMEPCMIADVCPFNGFSGDSIWASPPFPSSKQGIFSFDSSLKTLTFLLYSD